MASEDLEITEAAGFCRLRVRVKPGARNDVLLGWHGGALKIAVSAPPERGKANEAVIRLLAGHLGLPRDRVSIVSGAASRDKTVRVEGLTASGIRARLLPSGPGG